MILSLECYRKTNVVRDDPGLDREAVDVEQDPGRVHGVHVPVTDRAEEGRRRVRNDPDRGIVEEGRNRDREGGRDRVQDREDPDRGDRDPDTKKIGKDRRHRGRNREEGHRVMIEEGKIYNNYGCYLEFSCSLTYSVYNTV